MARTLALCPRCYTSFEVPAGSPREATCADCQAKARTARPRALPADGTHAGAGEAGIDQQTRLVQLGLALVFSVLGGLAGILAGGLAVGAMAAILGSVHSFALCLAGLVPAAGACAGAMLIYGRLRRMPELALFVVLATMMGGLGTMMSYGAMVDMWYGRKLPERYGFGRLLTHPHELAAALVAPPELKKLKVVRKGKPAGETSLRREIHLAALICLAMSAGMLWNGWKSEDEN